MSELRNLSGRGNERTPKGSSGNLWAVLLAVMLSAAGCASTREEKAAREYRQQQAAERFCEALIDFIIESI